MFSPGLHSLALLMLLSPMYISWRRSTSRWFLKLGVGSFLLTPKKKAVYRINWPAFQQVEGLAACRTTRLLHLHKVRTKPEQVPGEGNLNGL